MPEEEIQVEDDGMTAPAPSGKKKTKVVLLLVILLLAGGVLVVLLLTGNKEAEIDVDALLDEIPVVEVEVVEDEEEEEEEDLTLDFISNVIPSFDYSSNWHWAAMDQVVDTNAFGHRLVLSNTGIHFCDGCSSDPGPISMTGRFVDRVDLGENDSYVDYKISEFESSYAVDGSEVVELNGFDVTQVMLSWEGLGDSGVTNYREVLIYETSNVAVEITYSDESDEDEEVAWELLKSTIDFSALD